MRAYNRLMDIYRESRLVDTTQFIMQWDMETYMPPRGIDLRSEQISYLSRLVHSILTRPEIPTLLEEAEREIGSDEVARRNLYLMRREYYERTAVPVELVGEIAKQQSIALNKWRNAKAAKDWSRFAPELERLVSLSKKRAELLMSVRGTKSLYDALLDEYERGLPSEEIARVFEQLRKRLVPLAKRCGDVSRGLETAFMNRRVPIELQREIVADLADFIGYDIRSDRAGGRVDESEHPFTTGYFDDVRVTVHYYEDRPTSLVLTMLHEGGHALYEQNLNHGWMYQPVGQAASAGIHESMSRFIENMVGRSPEFWRYYYPRFRQLTGGTFDDVRLEAFVRAINYVRPSKIRIEADEVTYALHVIIRFEIEQALFADRISVNELPQVWNEKYYDYLGVEIENDSEGVMQDIHWAMAYYGYFPSYALGNIYDGMWLEKIDTEIPDWRAGLENGEFGPTKKWLTDTIYSRSALYDPADLVRKITGRGIDASPFATYLEKKYTELFDL